MGIKEQFNKIKDNWLIVLILIIMVALIFGSGSIDNMTGSNNLMKSGNYNYESYDSRYAPSYGYDSDFAPDETDRKIIKTANMGLETERGKFFQAEQQLKNIIKSSDSFLLNENSNNYETGRTSYRTGSYTIKIETGKYDSVIGQLKGIAEVKNFRENSADVTGSYTNLQIELDAENERLNRYKEMYNSYGSLGDKLSLTDRIFEQERKIKYIEESLQRIDQKIDYSTVTVTINEKRSNYANVAIVKLSDLLKTVVSSFNTLLYFLSATFPWALFVGVIYLVAKLFKKKSK